MVDATSAYAIVLRKAASDTVLIDANQKRANAEDKNFTLSLPHLIGGKGDLGVLPIKMSLDERKLLKKSAEIIKEKIDEYEKK